MTRRANRGRAVSVLGMVGALAASLFGVGCGQGPDVFQPVAYGARPWSPPPGWDPEPPCETGYYVAIDSCPGCTGISYALCTGTNFTQCTCGGSFTPGATCPQTFVCGPDDFPPQDWMEFTDYAGPGWAGLDLIGGEGDAGGQ
ncbi:MAG TPA: hypothetical protein VHG72_12920 [Polyangia bacterium]|nr:hypothetical protein [Polyangia bacterium]